MIDLEDFFEITSEVDIQVCRCCGKAVDMSTPYDACCMNGDMNRYCKTSAKNLVGPLIVCDEKSVRKRKN